MGLDRETLRQLQSLLRPLATRVANVVARAVVQLADDGKKLQLHQLGVLAGETIDGAEHHQPYGFSSVPLAGAEAVVVFPNGDRSHPIVITASDRRYRPTGGDPGQVVVYNHNGAKVVLFGDGDIEIHPTPGGEVRISDGGTAAKLVPLSEFLNHSHASFGAPPAEIVPSVPPGFDGTKVLKAE